MRNPGKGKKSNFETEGSAHRYCHSNDPLMSNDSGCRASPSPPPPSAAPRIIRRTSATQTFAPACDPATIVLVSGLKDQVLDLNSQLAESREDTIKAERALVQARSIAAEQLLEVRASAAVAEQVAAQLVAAKVAEIELLQKEVSQRDREVALLREQLGMAQGYVTAAKLDLTLLDRKHQRAVETMVHFREQAEGLERQLYKALSEREETTVLAAVLGNSRCPSCSPPSPLPHQGVEEGEDGDPCSVVLLRDGSERSASEGGEDGELGSHQRGSRRSDASIPELEGSTARIQYDRGSSTGGCSTTTSTSDNPLFSPENSGIF